jgi:predicted dehydrogenase
VVGAGTWGEQHARVFAGRTDTELVGIIGRTPERTERRAAAYGTTAYTNLDEMLASAKPDLVTTSLPNEALFAPALQLIRHGVPLLVEKPLVFSLEGD